MIKEAIVAITTICFITAIGSVVGSASNKSIIETNMTDMERYTWYNGEREEHVFAALNEIAIFPKNDAKDDVFVIIEHLPDRLNVTAMEDRIAEIHNKTGNNANFVFYRGPKRDQAPMALTGEIIVEFKEGWNETKVAGWAMDMRLSIVRNYSFSPNTYLFDAGSGLRSLEIANQIYLSGQVNYAYPNWWKTMALKDDPGIQTDQEIPKPTASLPETTTMETPKEVPFVSNFIVVILILLIFYTYRRKHE